MVLHHKTILEGSLDSQVDPRKATKQFVLLVTLQSYLPFPWGTVRAQHGLPHPHFLLHKIYVYQRQSLGETWAGGLGPDTGLLLCLLFSSSGQPGTKGVAVKHQSPGAPVPRTAASLGPWVSALGMEPRASLFNELPQQSF